MSISYDDIEFPESNEKLTKLTKILTNKNLKLTSSNGEKDKDVHYHI